MKSLMVLSLGAAVISLAGCASAVLHRPPPAEVHDIAVPDGFKNIRFWADAPPREMADLFSKRAETLRERFPQEISEGRPIQLNYLALSGGGSNGAYGAGLLNGWTEFGDRPVFDVVTGISTGALIAPFAFLGPDWDDEMREVYTTTSTDDILVLDALGVLSGIFGGPSVGDARPFNQIVARVASEEMIARVAEEHRKGRSLFVGTTALDAGRAVIWDMGAIANIQTPGAIQLFRNVLVASASIPGVFPPIPITVEADGKKFDELHVDGGVSSQVFIYPAQIDLAGFDLLIPVPVERRLFVLRNSQLKPAYENVQPGLFGITARSISVMINYSGIGDLFRMYFLTQRDGVAFNLAAIPEEFERVPKEVFDADYMRELYQIGYEQARTGYPWKDRPPLIVGSIATN